MTSTVMNAGLALETTMTPGRDLVVAAVPEATSYVSWDSHKDGAMPSPTSSAASYVNTGSGSLTVTKLLARPKTSSSVSRQQQQQQYVVGSRCSIQVLGETVGSPQPYFHSQSQVQFQERPKTSVARRRDRDKAAKGSTSARDRPGTSLRERSGTPSNRDRGGYTALAGKELPLPICTTPEGRAPAGDKDLMAITNKLKQRSGMGNRGIASLLGPTSRDRSAALLKELSLSFGLSPATSSKLGPTSPFKDCLREKWTHQSKDSPYGNGVTSSETYVLTHSRPLSPVKSMSANVDDASSVHSVSCSQYSNPATSHISGSRSERSQALTYFKEQLNIGVEQDKDSSCKTDDGESTLRSASPCKEPVALPKQQRPKTVRRSRSSPSVPTSSDVVSVTNEPIKKLKNEKVLTSPRVITINRVPSATCSKKKNRPKTTLATLTLYKDVNVPSVSGEEQSNSVRSPVPNKATLSTPFSSSLAAATEGVLASSSCFELGSKEWVPTKSIEHGETPCTVTTFDMALSPVHVDSTHPSPRARTASQVSEYLRLGSSPRSRTVSQVSDCFRPVSIKDDTTLRLHALHDQPGVVPSEFEAALAGIEVPRKREASPGLLSQEATPTNELSHGDHKRSPQHRELEGHASKLTPEKSTLNDELRTSPSDDHKLGNSSPARVRITQEELTAIMKAKPDGYMSFVHDMTITVDVTKSSGTTNTSLHDERGTELRGGHPAQVTPLGQYSGTPPDLRSHISDKLQTLNRHSNEDSSKDYGRFVENPKQTNSADDANTETVPAQGSVSTPYSDNQSDSESSSSTPSVPFPSGDLLYGNGEGSGVQGAGVRGHVEEVAVGDLGSWDPRTAEKKLKELDLHGNKRPTSRNSLTRKVANCDKVPFDREREELRPIANSLPTKQSPLRANGLKNNLLRADQILTQRANGSAGRDEDLVAMGTLWSPGQLQTRGSSTGTSSGKSTSGPSGPQSNAFSATGTLPVRRPINLSTSTSTRQLLHQNSTSSSLTGQSGGMGNIVRCSTKEVEPKYSDPLSGAPASFQQRLMELAALEAETVRWERSKKVKKKAPKQDRDS